MSAGSSSGATARSIRSSSPAWVSRVSNPDISGAGAENKFSGSIGGGVKIFFTDNIGLRLEGRGFWTLLDGNNDDYHYDDCWDCSYDYGYSNTFDQGQASAGLIIAW